MVKKELAITETNSSQNPVNELISVLLNFTPDQFRDFINDPITVSILQHGEAVEPALLEVS